MKITKAQRNLLEALEDEPQYCVECFKPAQKLVAHGLAAWVKDRGNLAITAEGRKFLEAQP